MVQVDFSGRYLNGDSCHEGDVCKILGEGAYSERDYEGRKSKQLDIPVSLEGKEMIYTPKMSEGKKLVEAFGAETAGWVGKRFACHIVKQKLYGQIKNLLEIEPIIDQKI